jgi:hypothetical protein
VQVEEDMPAAAPGGDAEMAEAAAANGPAAAADGLAAAAATTSDVENRDANAAPASTADKQAGEAAAAAGAAEPAAAAPVKKPATKVPQQKFNNVKVTFQMLMACGQYPGSPLLVGSLQLVTGFACPLLGPLRLLLEESKP